MDVSLGKPSFTLKPVDVDDKLRPHMPAAFWNLRDQKETVYFDEEEARYYPLLHLASVVVGPVQPGDIERFAGVLKRLFLDGDLIAKMGAAVVLPLVPLPIPRGEVVVERHLILQLLFSRSTREWLNNKIGFEAFVVDGSSNLTPWPPRA